MQVASSEWFLGVQIQNFENSYNVEIRDIKDTIKVSVLQFKIITIRENDDLISGSCIYIDPMHKHTIQ